MNSEQNDPQMNQNDSQNDSHDTKQALFVKHLLAGQTITNAATLVGISRPTATRWVRENNIKNALAQGKTAIQKSAVETQKSAHDIIVEKYKASLEVACDTVTEIAKNSEEPAAARLKAVQMILDRLAPLSQTQEQAPTVDGVIPKYLARYLTDEELDQIDRLTARAEERRAKAEADREALERKRM